MFLPVRCYVALGSNLQHPLHQVEEAVDRLSGVATIHLLRRSPWYRSAAVGPGQQPDYVNGVVELETTLAPEALLATLQGIEREQGRERTIRWGARTLDLDILLYGSQCINAPELQIPHPRMSERSFVLTPLAALNPDLCLPDPRAGKSATIAALLAQLPPEELKLLDGEREVVTL